MSVQFTQAQMADAVRQAGVPDMLNRYLTMTPEQIAVADAAVRKQVDDYRTRKVQPMKTAAEGSKAAQVAGLRTKRATTAKTISPATMKKVDTLSARFEAAVAEKKPKAERKIIVAGGLSSVPSVVEDKSNAGASTQAATQAPGPIQESNMKTNTAKKTTTARKPKGKAKTAARRPVKSKAARPTKAKVAGEAKVKAPKGMVVEILKLSTRANGVSPAELNELTKWKGAPWKWLFQNPKKNGYCDRWGYTLEVLTTEEGTRYKTTKNAD